MVERGNHIWKEPHQIIMMIMKQLHITTDTDLWNITNMI
jgi:hypothetical protein